MSFDWGPSEKYTGPGRLLCLPTPDMPFYRVRVTEADGTAYDWSLKESEIKAAVDVDKVTAFWRGLDNGIAEAFARMSEPEPMQYDGPAAVPAHFDKLPEAQLRKNQPVARGVLDYFPDALLAVAELSRIGNEQHNPGQPMHWAREKSTDHADCIIRHLIDRGTNDTDGVGHTVKVAWRALALLQTELEAADSALAAKRAK